MKPKEQNKQEEPKEQTEQAQTDEVPHAEDLIFKFGMQAFGENITNYLGQKDHIAKIAPTEQVSLRLPHDFEDFNFEMAEGYWRHYEFESDNVTVKDMRRFREYEAILSNTFKIPVITTVLCSASVKTLQSELTEGINTYKVEAIQLRERNSDEIFNNLQMKISSGIALTLDDLVPMLLTPLMSGSMSVYERISQGFRILNIISEHFDAETLHKMQAILYTFACKFLNKSDLTKLKETIGMTLLGEMLMNDGIKRGIEKGQQQKGMVCYLNAINRNLPHEEALAIAGISENDAAQAVSLRQTGML